MAILSRKLNVKLGSASTGDSAGKNQTVYNGLVIG